MNSGYRNLLLGKGPRRVRRKMRGRSKRVVGLLDEVPMVGRDVAELRSGHDSSRVDLLCCRVWYFSDGSVLGSRAFAEQGFQGKRERVGRKRQTTTRAWAFESV